MSNQLISVPKLKDSEIIETWRGLAEITADKKPTANLAGLGVTNFQFNPLNFENDEIIQGILDLEFRREMIEQ